MCIHGRRKTYCVECGKEPYNPKCIHGRRKHRCVDCGGRKQVNKKCIHGRYQYRCIDCGGHKRIDKKCIHNVIPWECKECNPVGHLAKLMRSRLLSGLKTTGIEKEKKTVEYLGTSFNDVKDRLQKKMELWNSTHDDIEHMTWSNTVIDHIKPLNCAKENHPYHSPIQHLTHHTNLQPLLKVDNLRKAAKWSSAADAYWRSNIYLNESYDAIFMLA